MAVCRPASVLLTPRVRMRSAFYEAGSHRVSESVQRVSEGGWKTVVLLMGKKCLIQCIFQFELKLKVLGDRKCRLPVGLLLDISQVEIGDVARIKRLIVMSLSQNVCCDGVEKAFPVVQLGEFPVITVYGKDDLVLLIELCDSLSFVIALIPGKFFIVLYFQTYTVTALLLTQLVKFDVFSMFERLSAE